MILFSVGTHHTPFVRMVEHARWLKAQGADVYFQGVGRGSLPGCERLPLDELHARMNQAHQLVVHAAPGSIASAHAMGHRPLIVPRDPLFLEHVDDHQRRYAQTLDSAAGRVVWLPQTLRWLTRSTRAVPHQAQVPLADLDALRSLLQSER